MHGSRTNTSTKRKQRTIRSRRRHLIEQLESRNLLAANPFGTNSLQPFDVNRDGRVNGLDALVTINAIARTGNSTAVADPADSVGTFIDVDGNGTGTALDALFVINALARSQPLIAATLPVDSAPDDRVDLAFDLITNDFELDLKVSAGELGENSVFIRVGNETSSFNEITDQFTGGSATLTTTEIDTLNGSPLPDGPHPFTVRIGDDGDEINFIITVDRQAPSPQPTSGAIVRVATDTLEVGFGESIVETNINPTQFSIRRTGEDVIPIERAEPAGSFVRLSLPEVIDDADFELTYDGTVTDLAGNAASGATTAFTVADPTGVASLLPFAGERDVRPNRNVFVDFDEAIEAASLSSMRFSIDAGNLAIDATPRLSADGRRLTLTLDRDLPSATTTVVRLDGDTITGVDGLAFDGDGDGVPGGMMSISFDTSNVTPVPGTSITGFIFDSTRSTLDRPVPVVGLTLRVEGAPEISTVTDVDGRFTLVDVPAPDFYVQLDASTATNAPDGFFYAGPEKPFHSVAGQSTRLNHHGEPFDIYLPLVRIDEATPIVPDQMTSATFGEAALETLGEIMPDVAPEVWRRDFRVEVPPNSVFFEDGRPAEELRVFALPSDQIPAPLPETIDSDFVFSIDAGGATQFDAPSRITFPNTGGFPPGARRPLYSFDHDLGYWVLTGHAVVSADGSVLETEAGGVNTLGWKVAGNGPAGTAGGGPRSDEGGDGDPDEGEPDEEDPKTKPPIDIDAPSRVLSADGSETFFITVRNTGNNDEHVAATFQLDLSGAEDIVDISGDTTRTVSPGGTARFVLTTKPTTDARRRSMEAAGVVAELVSGSIVVNATAMVRPSADAPPQTVTLDDSPVTQRLLRSYPADRRGVAFPSFLDAGDEAVSQPETIRIRNSTDLDLVVSGDSRVAISQDDTEITFTPEAGNTTLPESAIGVAGGEFDDTVSILNSTPISIAPFAIQTSAEIQRTNEIFGDDEFKVEGTIDIGLDGEPFKSLLKLEGELIVTREEVKLIGTLDVGFGEAISRTLFDGTVVFDRGSGQTTVMTTREGVRADDQPTLRLAGLKTTLSSLNVQQNQLILQGSIEMPDRLFGVPTGGGSLSIDGGNQIIVSPSGISVTGGAITLPNFTLGLPGGVRASAEGLTFEYGDTDGLGRFEVRGGLKLDDVPLLKNVTLDVGGPEDRDSYLRFSETGNAARPFQFDLVGTISAATERPDTPRDQTDIPAGPFKLRDLAVSFDTVGDPNVDGDGRISGEATVVLPGKKAQTNPNDTENSITGRLGWVGGRLDSIGVTARGIDKRIGTSFLFLREISGDLTNLSDPPKIEFSGSGTLTTDAKTDIGVELPPGFGGVVEGPLLTVVGGLKISAESFSVDATATVIGPKVLSGKLKSTVNFADKSLTLEGTVTGFNGALTINGSVSVNSSLDFSARGNATLRVPDDDAIDKDIRGKVLRSVGLALVFTNNSDFSDDSLTIGVQGRRPGFRYKVGARLSFDGKIDVLLGDEVDPVLGQNSRALSGVFSALSTGSSSFPIADDVGAAVFVLESEVDDPAGRLRLTDPSGTVYDESALAAIGGYTDTDVSDGLTRVVVVPSPAAGIWTVSANDGNTFENIEFRAFEVDAAAAPVAAGFDDEVRVEPGEDLSIDFTGAAPGATVIVSAGLLGPAGSGDAAGRIILGRAMADSSGNASVPIDTTVLGEGSYTVFVASTDSRGVPDGDVALPGRLTIGSSADLPAPTDVVAVATGDASARIVWTPVDGATGYQLRYSAINPDSGAIVGRTELIIVGDDAIADVTDLTAGQTYRFEIAATDADELPVRQTASIALTVGSAASAAAIAAGSVTESIIGTRFDDVNRDGIRQVGEASVFNTTIELLDPVTLTRLAVTRTDSNGRFQFDGFAPGLYSIRYPARPRPDDPAAEFRRVDIVSGEISADNLPVGALPAADSIISIGDGLELGDVGRGSITGTIVLDANSDGVSDGAIDRPLGSFLVFIDQNFNGRLDDFEPWTLSAVDDPTSADVDETGRYRFDGLPPGPHTVGVVSEGILGGDGVPRRSVTLEPDGVLTDVDVAVPIDPGVGRASTPRLVVLDGLSPVDEADAVYAHDFGSVAADGTGSESATMIFRVVNRGLATLNFDSVEFAGTDGRTSAVAAGVTVDAGADIRLLPSSVTDTPSFIDVLVTFDPSVAGALEGELRFRGDPAGVVGVNLSGLATPVGPSLSARVSGGNNFGGGVPGERSASRDLILANVGTEPLVVSSFERDDRFMPIGDVSLPMTIPPGGEVAVAVAMTADGIGLQPGGITVTSDDAMMPTMFVPMTGTGVPASGPQPTIGENFFAVRGSETTTLRGRTRPDGSYSVQIRFGEPLESKVFDLETGLIASASVTTSGTAVRFPSNPFRVSTDRDSDGDGMPDEVERVVGTDSARADSDGDGLSDLFELIRGSDPVVGSLLPTGLVGGLELPGSVGEVTLAVAAQSEAGDLQSTLGEGMEDDSILAFVSSRGGGDDGDDVLSIVNVTRVTAPILTSTLSLGGDISSVAVSADGRQAAVAAGGRGVHLLDVSDSLTPVLNRTVSDLGSISAVKMVDGLVAAAGQSIWMLDPVTGEVLQEIELRNQAGRVTDLVQSGDTLYAVSGNIRLHSIALDGTESIELDSIDIPVPPFRRIQPEDMRLYVADGIAYLSNGIETNLVAPGRPLERGGYVTFDVSDPATMSLLSNIELEDMGNDQTGNLQTVLTGSGLALVAAGATLGLQVHDASDPSDTYTPLTNFATTGTAEAVAVVGGIAFVADGPAGLQVINYRDIDALGVAPTITIDSNALDADPASAGIQVEEGTRVRINPRITDDVQVRSAELLVDGVVVQSDLQFPYDFSVVVPSLSSGQTDIDIVVRATDTGGNRTTSDPINLQVIEDITPPVLRRLAPDGPTLIGTRIVQATFNEPIDISRVDLSTVEIIDRGNTDISLQPTSVSFQSDDRTVLFRFDTAFAEGEYQLRLDQSDFADRGGNLLAFETLTQDFDILDATAVWQNESGGDWFDPTNWSTGQVPGPEDGVLILLEDGAVVTIGGGATANVQRLTLAGELHLQSGTLESDLIRIRDGELRLSSGIVRDSVIVDQRTPTAGEELESAVTIGTVSLQGVTLNTDALVGRSARTTVTNGLTVNGTLKIGGTGGGNLQGLTFAGTQTLGGTGAVLLTDEFGETVATRNFLTLANADAESSEVLTIGSELTVGGFGSISVQDATNDSVQFEGSIDGIDGGDLIVSGVSGDIALNDPFASVTLTTDLSDLTVNGTEGTVLRIGSGSLSNVTLNTDALVGRSARTTVTNGLTVNGTLKIGGTGGGNLQGLTFAGTQTLGGTGAVLLTDEFGETVATRNFLTLANADAESSEVLTIGSELTVGGFGSISVQDATNDSVQFEGSIDGIDGGDLIVSGVSGDIALNDPFASVTLTTDLSDLTVNGTEGTVLRIGSGSLSNVTLNTDALVGRSARTTVTNGLTVNGTLKIGGTGGGNLQGLTFAGTQTLGGTGAVLLTDEFGETVATRNFLTLANADAESSEVLTIGSELTVGGFGSISVQDATNDSVQFEGSIDGIDGGDLIVSGVSGDIALNDPFASVTLTTDLSDLTVNGTEGTVLRIGSGSLSNVTLNTDALVGRSARTTVTNGLTVNGTLKIGGTGGGNLQGLTFAGTQTLGGTGAVLLTDEFGETVATRNFLTLANADADASEVLTIGSELTVGGFGTISSNDPSQDKIEVLGSIALGAGDQLVVGSGVELLASLIAVGIGGTTTDQFGRITGDATLELPETLRIVREDNFLPVVGKSFQIFDVGEITGAVKIVKDEAFGDLRFDLDLDLDEDTLTLLAADR